MIWAPLSACPGFSDREITTMAELPTTPTPSNVRENVTRSYPAKAIALNEKHTGGKRYTTPIDLCVLQRHVCSPVEKKKGKAQQKEVKEVK